MILLFLRTHFRQITFRKIHLSDVVVDDLVLVAEGLDKEEAEVVLLDEGVVEQLAAPPSRVRGVEDGNLAVLFFQPPKNNRF